MSQQQGEQGTLNITHVIKALDKLEKLLGETKDEVAEVSMELDDFQDFLLAFNNGRYIPQSERKRIRDFGERMEEKLVFKPYIELEEKQKPSKEEAIGMLPPAVYEDASKSETTQVVLHDPAEVMQKIQQIEERMEEKLQAKAKVLTPADFFKPEWSGHFYRKINALLRGLEWAGSLIVETDFALLTRIITAQTPPRMGDKGGHLHFNFGMPQIPQQQEAQMPAMTGSPKHLGWWGNLSRALFVKHHPQPELSPEDLKFKVHLDIIERAKTLPTAINSLQERMKSKLAAYKLDFTQSELSYWVDYMDVSTTALELLTDVRLFLGTASKLQYYARIEEHIAEVSRYGAQNLRQVTTQEFNVPTVQEQAVPYG